MLSEIVVFSGLFLVVTSCPLFAWSHRLQRSHWAWSQLFVVGMGAAAWLAQHAITGHAPPLVGTLTVTLLVGSVITGCCTEWSAPAHATFTAAVFTVSAFLAYAAFVLFAAHLGPVSFAFGIILLLLQVAVLVLLLAHTFEILDVVCRTRWNRQFGAVAVPGYCPKVSIHVPTHNEPPALVIETLDALALLSYENFEVLVIDNNTADEALWRPVEAHCKKLGKRFRFFHLLPWPGFKSGALNYALGQVSPDTEIITIVDADYLVEPNYLKDLVGHFADPKVAFVQTPQDYRDVPAHGRYGRALYLSYQYFFDISMASRNERNAIIFAGTMGLLRHSALKEVGGWDEWCITEDAEVSFRLLQAGYQSVFVAKSYGRGLMPVDYAGLKKQRFRWAFGGMQLLRMHAPAVFGRQQVGQLTIAQRYAYISGGLQWLNDPVTFGFSIVLLMAATALVAGGSLYLQPLAGASVLIPPLLIWFGVMRFVWALRVRSRCSWREAFDALSILLGLTWIVTLACARGLTARQGVFLRTPKESTRPRLIDAVRIVWFELLLAVLCFVALSVIIVQDPSAIQSARTVLLGMLAWQGLVYASAVRTSFQSYQSYAPSSEGLLRRVTSDYQRTLPELRLAGRVAAAALVFSGLFWVAVLLAPGMERVWRSDPLNQFITMQTLLPREPPALVGAQLVREAEATRQQDIEAVLALWSPNGVITDHAFTPDVDDDNHVWRGRGQIRERYQQEFHLRQYRSLRHLNPVVTFNGPDEATIVNDLDAVIETNDGPARVALTKTDRWTLRRESDRWRIIALDVNGADARREPQPDTRTLIRWQQ